VADPRYTLEAVEALRKSERARAELALAKASEAVRLAQAEVERAVAAQRSHRQDASAARPAGGLQRALDLQRQAAFELQRAEQHDRMRREVETTRQRLREAQAELSAAERALAERHADASVIERDRERWERDRRRGQERAEQAELDERQLARRSRPS
jgi:hypothetical protein